ncbi:MAG: hypothetical protein Harvfovirus86_2 [Harvfovirus sp.]|uniref:Sel1 repeat family protein n=1 Tax=Harvfovirus sp. TaxID=2487768 RepID=A0A3G5A416_9VIRU|nr:MAG: hypothetical protein Harvfovirus86_2 [Harvfovirus sp.]
MTEPTSLFIQTKNLITQSLTESYYYNSTSIEKNMHRLTYENQKELYDWLLTQSNNTHIMKLIGNFFEYGLGYLKIDYDEALKWYLNAAEKNNTNAINIIASYYIKGRAVQINYSLAINWYERAVALGDCHAMNHLGLIHKRGLGVNKDNPTALKWFKLAADHGSTDALWNIADQYETSQDLRNALKYYTIAYHNYKIIKNKMLCKKKIEHLMRSQDMNIEILQEWIMFKDENKTLKDEIDSLTTELSYRPDGPGYQQAKDEFESLSNKKFTSPSPPPSQPQ